MASMRRWAVGGSVGALLAASMAAAGFGIAEAASSSAPSHPAGSLTHAGSAAAAPKSPWPSGTGWAGAPGMAGPGARAGGFGFRGGVGTITAITTSSVTVKSQQGGSVTVATTSKTVYVEAMSVIPRSDLKVGENIGVLAKPATPPHGPPASWSPPSGASTPGTSGSVTSSAAPTASRPTAAAIEILVPRLGGRVVSVSGSSIVLADPSGLQQTLVTTGSTTYRELDTMVRLSAVKTGEDVVGFGAVAGDHSKLDASTVAIVGPLAGGKVTAVSGSTITVKSPRGESVLISTSSSTIFRSDGGASSLAHVKTGDLVLALGLSSGTTGFTASGIWFGTTPGPAGALRIALGLGWLTIGATGSTGGPLGSGGFAGGGGGGFGRFGPGHGELTPGSPGASGGSPGSSATTT